MSLATTMTITNPRKRYFCVGLLGESGWVISTNPALNAGFKYLAKKLGRCLSDKDSMISLPPSGPEPL
jgi:hypothetical protein